MLNWSVPKLQSKFRKPIAWVLDHQLMMSRIGIIGLVLLLSIAIPLKMPGRGWLLVIAPPIALLGLLYFIRYPGLGLATLVVTGLILPSPSLPGGINFAVLHLILLVGLWFMDMLVVKKKISFIPSVVTTPILVFIVVVFLAFISGQLPWFLFANPAPLESQLGGVAIFVLSVITVLMAGQQLQDMMWLRWVTWAFIIIGSLHVGSWLIPPIDWIFGDIFPNSVTSNSMFWLWLGILPFSQGLLNKDLSLKVRAGLLAISLATLYVAFVLNSGWKSGYLPLLVGLAVVIGARSWRFAAVIGLICIGPAIYIGQDAIASDQYSYSTRLDAWIIILEMVKTSPILGFGPSNYYWYTPLFPIRGYSVVFNSHNQYLDIVAQIGLLGLGSFLWFAGRIGWMGWNLKNKEFDGFSTAYIYGALGGLAGMLASGVLVDWFFPFVYNIGFSGFRASMLAWVYLGGLVSLEQIDKARSKTN